MAADDPAGGLGAVPAQPAELGDGSGEADATGTRAVVGAAPQREVTPAGSPGVSTRPRRDGDSGATPVLRSSESGRITPTGARAAGGPPAKIGRNEPCWCGSGRKFKLCHGAS
jgi:hypothetical protein